jgi:hypothetical protein
VGACGIRLTSLQAPPQFIHGQHPIPRTRVAAMKIKLNLETVSVQSFQTGREAAELRGTVHAHAAAPTATCNTRNPFCQTPSVYQPCITDEVECT